MFFVIFKCFISIYLCFLFINFFVFKKSLLKNIPGNIFLIPCNFFLFVDITNELRPAQSHVIYDLIASLQLEFIVRCRITRFSHEISAHVCSRIIVSEFTIISWQTLRSLSSIEGKNERADLHLRMWNELWQILSRFESVANNW